MDQLWQLTVYALSGLFEIYVVFVFFLKIHNARPMVGQCCLPTLEQKYIIINVNALKYEKKKKKSSKNN